jgi:hypothetical protein
MDTEEKPYMGVTGAVIVITTKPYYFCPKHGNVSDKPGKCPQCNEDYVAEEPSTVTYICDKCGVRYIAPPSYFQEHPLCSDECKGALHNACTPQSSFNFVIDGNWNGGNVGKKIQQKNEQVKKKWAGMSYEQTSLKEKIGTMVNEKLGGG